MKQRTLIVLLELQTTQPVAELERQLFDLYSKDADPRTQLAQIHIQVTQAPAKDLE